MQMYTCRSRLSAARSSPAAVGLLAIGAGLAGVTPVGVSDLSLGEEVVWIGL
jgi:hypothetical protein